MSSQPKPPMNPVIYPLLPVEAALSPDVGEAEQEFEQKDHHGHEAGPADITQSHAPRKQERRLKVENDEKNCDEIVTHIELHTGVFEGFEAALVRRVLFGVRLAGTENLADA